MVRCTFSPARAWRPAVVARLARTLGITNRMSRSLIVEPLARHPELIPLLAGWFVSEWPTWYGIGCEGNVTQDLQEFAASETSLPIGFVVFSNGTPTGAGALKAESIPSHKHLSPWAAAGFVIPEQRGQGVGAALLGKREDVFCDA